MGRIGIVSCLLAGVGALSACKCSGDVSLVEGSSAPSEPVSTASNALPEAIARFVLPFAELSPADEGPRAHFFALLADQIGKVASCAPSATGLDCTVLDADADYRELRTPARGIRSDHLIYPTRRYLPSGPWESASFVPIEFLPSTIGHTGIYRLFHEGRVEDLGMPGEFFVADAKGTVLSLSEEEERVILHVRRADGARTDLDVATAVGAAGLKNVREVAKTARLVGAGLWVSDGTKAFRFPWGPGSSLGLPTEAPPSKYRCRAGRYHVFEDAKGVTFIDFETSSRRDVPFTFGEPDFRSCRPSGVIASPRALCHATSGRCLDYPSHGDVDVVGDRIFSAKRGGLGLVVYVGDPDFSSTVKEVVVIDPLSMNTSLVEGPILFGLEDQALVFARYGDLIIGARVSARGDVAPIEIARR